MSSEKLFSFDIDRNKEDVVLWSAFKSGDRTAFGSIYNQYVDYLYNYGRQIVSEGSFVEDVIQELFINLWNSRERLSEVNCIKSYLLKSLRRDLLKKQKKHRKIQSNLFSIDIEAFAMNEFIQVDMISSTEEKERIEYIRKTVNNFSGRQKEILYLKFYQSLSYEEIAQVLELDLKYVYNTASKAYKKLRLQLAPVLR